MTTTTERPPKPPPFRKYVDAGFSCIPIAADGSKAPCVETWKPYEKERPTIQQAAAWERQFRGDGVAVLGGIASDNLEILDIDEPELVEPCLEQVDADLLDCVCLVRTPRRDEHGNAGLHICFRCPAGFVVPGNQKLAMSEPRLQFTADGEPVINPKTNKHVERCETMIETRGTGGYCLTVGCSPACHPTGNLYEHVGGCELVELKPITIEQRETLMCIASLFDKSPRDDDHEPQPHRDNGSTRNGLSPGDDFANRTSWRDILEPHGWKVVREYGGFVDWLRPGKEHGKSATSGYVSKDRRDLLIVFSNNAEPFLGISPITGRSGASYNKFSAYALLNHDGGFTAAAKELARQGFGDQQNISKLVGENVISKDSLIANCIEKDTKDGVVTVPLKMSNIIDNARKLTDDWPRRVDNALFVHADDDIHFLPNEANLFGFYHRVAGGVLWKGGKRLVAKRELFAELTRTATAYKAVERLPHEPRITSHYYACGEDFASGNGDHLRRLLDRFTPATDIDRDLILAAFVTPGWGGPPGTRPAFVITSDHGRGIGKTTLAEMVGLVWQGILSFSHREDINKIKTRLLTPDALTRRVALLDNVKSLKFSWSELEGMITATDIGGHRMYIGEATRPNTLTWFITLNGASLSTDMAQRAAVIQLDKPKRSGTWSDDTRQFIIEHREAIVSDIIGFLRSEPYPLERFSRWSTWEREVLARLPEPSDAQTVIEERQVGVDVEAEEAEHIEEHIADKLRWLGYKPTAEWVFIPNRVINKWVCEAQNDRLTTSQTTRMLKQMATEGRVKRLKEHRAEQGRGFMWTTGELCTQYATDIAARLAEKKREEQR